MRPTPKFPAEVLSSRENLRAIFITSLFSTNPYLFSRIFPPNSANLPQSWPAPAEAKPNREL